MHREFWEQRYSEAGWAYGTEPNAFLAQQRALLRPGMAALVVGDGEGRNGVWLARQGIDVTSVDYSSAGLSKARALAAQHGVPLKTECVDLTEWAWPVNAYDLVIAIYIHFAPATRARMHANMWHALRPGGVLIIEAFNPRQVAYHSGGPRDPAMLYTEQMLRADFPDARIELLHELVTELDEGKYHSGAGAVVRLVARK